MLRFQTSFRHASELLPGFHVLKVLMVRTKKWAQSGYGNFVQEAPVAPKVRGTHMGGGQNCGPLLGPLNTRCRIILRTQRGTIILRNTICGVAGGFYITIRHFGFGVSVSHLAGIQTMAHCYVNAQSEILEYASSNTSFTRHRPTLRT